MIPEMQRPNGAICSGRFLVAGPLVSVRQRNTLVNYRPANAAHSDVHGCARPNVPQAFNFFCATEYLLHKITSTPGMSEREKPTVILNFLPTMNRAFTREPTDTHSALRATTSTSAHLHPHIPTAAGK